MFNIKYKVYITQRLASMKYKVFITHRLASMKYKVFITQNDQHEIQGINNTEWPA